MIRLLFFELFIFFLPFLLYALYLLAVKQKETGQGFWEEAPIFNLSMTGLLLVGGGIIAYGLYWS